MYQLDEIEGDIRYEVKGNRLILKIKSEAFPNIPSGGGDCNIEIIPSTKLGRILATDENIYSALSTDFRIAEEFNNFLVDINGMYLRKDIDDEASGVISFKKKIGSSIFIDGWEGKGWEIAETGAALFDSTRVRSDIYLGNKFGSPSFASGFTGWGVEIDIPTATAEMDNLFIRKTFTAYEIVYSQIYGLGGSQVVSDINKIARVEVMSDRYRCYMDDMDGLMLMNLRKGDGVRIQTRTGTTSIKYLMGRCIGVDSEYFDIAIPLLEGGGQPEAGDFAMRWGNNEDVNRQGLIYLTTADRGAPYIDVYDGITGVSTEGKLKARLGNLSGIRTMSGDQLAGYGAYLNGIYIENSTFYTDNGQTVDQRFVAMNGKFESEISGIKNNMSLESGNVLRNSSFGRDTNYWISDNVVRFIDVAGQYLWMDSSFYVEKNSVADIYNDGGQNVLRILNTTISQPNAFMNITGHSDVQEDGYTYSFAFYAKVVRSGMLSAGIPDTELFIEQQLSATDGYQKITKFGKWNEKGDFRLQFTGEILIYGVSLFNDALADAQIKLQTQIDQTNEYIKLLATKDYVDSETGQIYIHYDSQLQITAEQMSGISTKVDNINNTIESSGWITAADGTSIFAKKEMENGSSIVNAVNIGTGGIQIQANRVALSGAVSFSMLSDYTSVNNRISNASNKADSAYSYADSAWDEAIDALNEADAASKLAGTANTNATNAYSKAVEALTSAGAIPEWAKKSSVIEAMKYNSLIVGGYLNTQYITVNEIQAVKGSISGFTIEGSRLYNTDFTSYIEISDVNRFLQIGGNKQGLIDIRNTMNGKSGIRIYASGFSIGDFGQNAYAIQSTGWHAFIQRDDDGWSSPGLLYSGLFEGYSTLTKYWSVIGLRPSITYITNNGGTRRWRVTHNLGHTNYVPMMTAFKSTSSSSQSQQQTYPLITGIFSNYFEFTMKNTDNRAELNEPALICIFGRNLYLSFN